MASDEDWLYYLAREAVARACAVKAVDPIVSNIHEEFADAYAAKALEARPTKLVRSDAHQAGSRSAFTP